jgi:hypothetical protein
LAWSGEALQLGEIMNEEQVARCRKMHPDLPCILSPQSLRQRLQSRRVEILEAWDAWAETKERALAACGFPACGEEADALGEKLTELELRVFATKAHTPAGWRLKARVTYELVGDEQDGTYENHALHSLLRDLIAEERPLG